LKPARSQQVKHIAKSELRRLLPSAFSHTTKSSFSVRSRYKSTWPCTCRMQILSS